MSYTNGVVSVGNTATVICNPGPNGVVVQNQGTVTVSLGGPTVTASGANGGYQLAAGGVANLPSHPLQQVDADDRLYGITSAGASNIAFITGP